MAGVQADLLEHLERPHVGQGLDPAPLKRQVLVGQLRVRRLDRAPERPLERLHRRQVGRTQLGNLDVPGLKTNGEPQFTRVLLPVIRPHTTQGAVTMRTMPPW